MLRKVAVVLVLVSLGVALVGCSNPDAPKPSAKPGKASSNVTHP